MILSHLLKLTLWVFSQMFTITILQTRKHSPRALSRRVTQNPVSFYTSSHLKKRKESAIIDLWEKRRMAHSTGKKQKVKEEVRINVVFTHLSDISQKMS